MGKGDKQRPKVVSEKILEDNWNDTFKILSNKMRAMSKEEQSEFDEMGRVDIKPLSKPLKKFSEPSESGSNS